MATDVMEIKIKVLHQKLTDCLNAVNLGVAGRFVYYDKEQNAFILAMHTTSPEKTHTATQFAFNSIPDDLKAELQEANIGFAGKQI